MPLEFITDPNSSRPKNKIVIGRDWSQDESEGYAINTFSSVQTPDSKQPVLNKEADTKATKPAGSVDIPIGTSDLSSVPVPDLTSQPDLMNMYNARVQAAQDINASRALAKSMLADMTNLKPDTSITGAKMWRVQSKTE